jgi:hypothetical protein
MTGPGTREVLDPRWRELERERLSIVWEIQLQSMVAQVAESFWGEVPYTRALASLREWESRHADKWNRLKPWYAPRLKGRG